MLFVFGAFVGLCALFVGSVVVLAKLARLLTPAGVERRPRATAAPASAPPPELDLAEAGVRRYNELLEMGIDPVTAVEAALADVDIPALRGLLERSCPPELALRILEDD